MDIKHKIEYSQKFPWPGFWRTMKDPFYRKIYLNTSERPRDLIQFTYQVIKKWLNQ